MVVALCSIACGDAASVPDAGGDPDPQVDAAVEAAPVIDNGSPSNVYPAFSIDAPEVTKLAGPVLAKPKVVPVYFSNDDATFTDSITAYLGKLAGSTYWSVLKEYGVGVLTIAAPVTIAAPAPATLAGSDVEAWLAAKIADATLPADTSTIYALFYPSGTSIGFAGLGSSCSTFGGYHSSIATTAVGDVAYAVIPRCASFNGFTGLDAVTSTSSHELVEAAANPFLQDPTRNAYSQVDAQHLVWSSVLGGGEIGDLCAANQNVFYAPSDIGNEVQRVWSNASAAAGHNPCAPVDELPYFNAMPQLTDDIAFGKVTTRGVKIPVGQSKTIEIDLFSDAPTGTWNLSAFDVAQLQKQPSRLQFSWDRTAGKNGEKVHLTITVVKGSSTNSEGFIIGSSAGGRATFWVGLVGN
jgi:hypothetical protein